jgi:hypothetical protein
MKKATMFFGAVLILLGLASLIHPRVDMPARRTEVQVLGQRLLVETRRIVTIPILVSSLLIATGAGLLMLGLARK